MSIKVKCPLCKGVLWIDPSTGRVIDSKKHDDKKMELNDFVKSTKDSGARLEKEFEKSKREAEERKNSLEQEFRNLDKYKTKGDDERPENPFDWD